MINLGSFLTVNPLNVLPPSEEYLYFKEEQRESTKGEMCGQGMLLTIPGLQGSGHEPL